MEESLNLTEHKMTGFEICGQNFLLTKQEIASENLGYLQIF